MGRSNYQLQTETVNCLATLHSRTLVPDQQMKLFCEILHFRADDGENYHTERGRAMYYERIQPLINRLQFPLCRPRCLTKLILPKQSEYTYLCDLHRGLNADFVHQWFKLLALEVGARLEDLRAGTEKMPGSYFCMYYIKPLTRLHKMWESPERTREAFGDLIEFAFNEDVNLIDATQQRDQCEACILARIGGHPETIMCLRAIVKSRITPESQERHRSRLRLLRLTENWIALWQASDTRFSTDYSSLWAEKLKDNDLVAEDLWEIRKEVQIERQRIRKNYRHKLSQGNLESWKYEEAMKALDSSEKTERNSIYDAENDIIDAYAALRATQRTSRFFSMLNSSATAKASNAPKTSHRAEMLTERFYGRDQDRRQHQARESRNEPDVPSDSLSNMKISSSDKDSTDTYSDPFYLESKYPTDSSRKDIGATLGRNAPYVSRISYANSAYRESRYSVDTIKNNDRVLRTGGSSIHLPQRASTVSRLSRNSRQSFESKSRPLRRSSTVMTRITEESPTVTEYLPLQHRQQLPLAERDANGMFRVRYSSTSPTIEPESEEEGVSHDEDEDEDEDEDIPNGDSSWITASIPDSSLNIDEHIQHNKPCFSATNAKRMTGLRHQARKSMLRPLSRRRSVRKSRKL